MIIRIMGSKISVRVQNKTRINKHTMLFIHCSFIFSLFTCHLLVVIICNFICHIRIQHSSQMLVPKIKCRGCPNATHNKFTVIFQDSRCARWWRTKWSSIGNTQGWQETDMFPATCTRSIMRYLIFDIYNRAQNRCDGRWDANKKRDGF